MANIKIADKPTLDTVKTNTDTTNTKLGNTADTGATASTGSVNGKLNKLITDASTNMGYVMEGEYKSITPSTSSITPTGNGTKVQKIGSFSFSHTGKAKVVIIAGANTTVHGSATVTFYVSTYSTASPAVSNLDSNNKGKSSQGTINQQTDNVFCIHTSSLTSGTTYYIHVVITTNVPSPAYTYDVSSIHAGLSYATSTPCTSVIKSVQSGVTIQTETFVTINSVAPEKCLVIVNDTYQYGGDASWTQNTGCILLPTKLFFVTNTTHNNGMVAQSSLPVTWQVIEFY